jgi:hypothetical protein
MAQQLYSVDLKRAKFPLLSELQTQTIINFSSVGKNSGDEAPQIAYCENVFPTLEGIESVQFQPVIPAAIGLDPGDKFIDARIIYGSELNRFYLATSSSGTFWVLDETDIENPFWVKEAIPSLVIASPYDPELLTIGTVNGVSHLFYRGNTFISTYDEATKAFVNVVPAALDMSAVLGFTATSGYLVAYTKFATAWSSTITPTDFVPSLVTGAGGGNVNGIAGAILFATPTPLGMNFYTQANVIGASYTGNVRYPFKFREVENSKGGINLDQIAYEANSDPQYVYTKAGFQTINTRVAETVLPEVTDFLTGRRIETYDKANVKLVERKLTTSEIMLKKVKYINSRYILISYGIDEFTHSIVYDTSLSRMGKIALDHTDVFEYVGDQTEIAKQSVTYLHADGSCTVSFFNPVAPPSPNNPGVVMLARMKASHTRQMTLLGVLLTLIGVDQTDEEFKCFDMPSPDGLNEDSIVSPVSGFLAQVKGNLREYHWRQTADNHNILIQGKFRLTTALITYTINGRR